MRFQSSTCNILAKSSQNSSKTHLCYNNSMRKLLLLVFMYSLIFNPAYGYERSYAFIVKMFGQYVKVVSPQKYTDETSVIIENKTLSKIYGKVVTQTGRLIKYFSVPENKFNTIALKLSPGEKAFVVPLSPAFQSFELKFGSLSYEIPPKK